MDIALLQSAEEVSKLSPVIRRLAVETRHDDDTTFLPDYFLPRVAAGHRPRVVLCFELGRLIGVVYAQERVVAGAGSGWFHGGDETGRGLLLASPQRETDVLAAACEHLLQNGAHALRLRWRSTGHDGLPVLRLEYPGVQVWCRSEFHPNGDWLHIGADYETFLEGLGPRTRRNLRHYRHRAERQGLWFVPDLSIEKYEAAVTALADPERAASLRDRDARDQRFFSRFASPYNPRVLAGLATPEGRLISVVSGVCSGDHMHLLSQFNDESLAGQSVSMVLRSHLIEHLIGRGIRQIHFVNGASGALARFCDPVVVRTIAVDDRRSALHPLKATAAHAARHWQNRGHLLPPPVHSTLGSYLARH